MHSLFVTYCPHPHVTVSADKERPISDVFQRMEKCRNPSMEKTIETYFFNDWLDVSQLAGATRWGQNR